MSKKDYVAFATAIGRAKVKAVNSYHDKEASIDMIIDAIVNVLREDNTLFDVSKFKKYMDKVIDKAQESVG